MIASDKDPIAAISTAAGRGGIGIVRLSFSRALERKMLGRLFPGKALTPRHAHLLAVPDEKDRVLDRAVVLYFPGPASATGESVLEIQAHGGPVLMNLILKSVLGRCADLGMRLAEPGEFTKRAYLNDRIDLAQAEAVSDLIDAASESAVHAASRSLSGEFSEKITQLGREVDEVRAFMEAALDFPEEEEDFLGVGRIPERMAALLARMDGIAGAAARGKVLREGASVALVGSPNVGKSSLLNALAGEEVAIVTEIAGTTRDRIEHWISLDGIPFRMVDTAGVRATRDPIEKKGIERTLEAVSSAEVVLHLVDASGRVEDSGEALSMVMDRVRGDALVLTVANKCDLLQGRKAVSPGDVLVSSKTGEGLDALRQRLREAVGLANTSEGVFMARERHLRSLREARIHLEAALGLAGSDRTMPELAAEELRLCARSLGEILGETTPDDILGMIFSKFCIGK